MRTEHLNITHVVGARPNFMKAAPVFFALQAYPKVKQLLVHTGQHYDERMSEVFFRQLGMPRPDVNLEVGSGSHAFQTAEIMVRFEKVLNENGADWLVVYGDVNSTLACALVAAKLGVRVAHVEAGLRSFDRTMPEEVNRVLTDQMADLLFTPSADGDENLRREGIALEKIHLVGNCMIDTLVRLLDRARKPEIEGLEQRFALITLHRPANVDDPAQLERVMRGLAELSEEVQIVFPVHPRTRQRLESSEFRNWAPQGLVLVEPQGYLEFLWLQQHATMIVTDSGGIQEEATFLRVPCITMRESTERPITCTVGTNVLIGTSVKLLKAEAHKILAGEKTRSEIPPLWDGKAGQRIAALLAA